MYKISSHRCWSQWKSGKTPGSDAQQLPAQHRRNDWWCDSLQQATQHYSWTEGPVPYANLVADLQQQMSTGTEPHVADACCRLYDWGNVGSAQDRAWLNNQAAAGTLKSSIRTAIRLLRPSTPWQPGQWAQLGLPMNSATTKVYAAADPSGHVIMYDGRVGAALGLLTRGFLQRKLVPLLNTPPGLDFMWGRGRDTQYVPDPMHKRNPSTGVFRFRCLGGATDEEHAEVCATASAVLFSATSGVPLREIEKALFMIGYAVKPPDAQTII
jgi:hypothetical protein